MNYRNEIETVVTIEGASSREYWTFLIWLNCIVCSLCCLPLKVNYAVKQLQTWFSKNELILNVEKSCVQASQPRQWGYVCRPSVMFSSAQMAYTPVVKFLGIDIIESQRWQIQINSLCTKLSKVYFMIKCLRDCLNIHMIKNVYHAHFQSWLKYGLSFWGRKK